MNLDNIKLPVWLQNAVASLGGFGLFVVAFLDSSVMSFPVINDLLVIHLSVRNPAAMPFYAAMATLGSVAGSIWLYYLAKKGGEAMLRRRVGQRTERVRRWVERSGFLSIAIPSVLPPPMPFKAFVLAAGVFQMPLRVFVVALVVARGVRYFGEGLLAVRYGRDAARYLMQNKLEFTLIVLAVIVASYLLTRLLFRSTPSNAQGGETR
jgi:membrane protein YqaA with SNARE-associated domain